MSSGGMTRRELLRASAMTAVGIALAACSQPAPQVIEKEVPVEKVVKETVVVEKQVPVEKVQKETVVVEKQVVVEKVVTATPVPAKFGEAPMLAELVKAGKLPPVEERLPQNPMVVEPVEQIGKYGGTWTSMISKASDTKLGTVFGHVRLVDWDRTLTKIVPEVCETFEVNGGKDFTFHLRKGIKWSDGTPLTSADFRYWWEDVANNAELSPNGIPVRLMIEGKPPVVTFPDDYTIRYVWDLPNAVLLGMLAASTPLQIFVPAHYIKQFHTKYGDKASIDALIKAGGHQDWMALYGFKARDYAMDNPELPTVQQWVPTTVPPADKYTFVRNPYCFKVDTEGNQLPYLDEMVYLGTDGKLIALKCTAGDADLQQRSLGFADITLLKENESKGGYGTRMWKTDGTSVMSVYPNLTCTDIVLRDLMRDKRFRIALSYAINRDEINQVLYLGMATPMQSDLLPGVPGYNEEWSKMHTEFDLAKANALLDEMGLTKRDGEGYRLRPDGNTLDLILEDAGETPIYADIVELITATWKQIGVKALYKVTERATFRQRVISGDAPVALWGGGSGIYWIPFEGPANRLPVDGGTGCLWGVGYGLWHVTKGKEGEEPPDVVKRLQELGDSWFTAASEEESAKIQTECRQIYNDERYEIGTVGALPTPVVVKTGFRNVPQEGFCLWDPGGYLGWCDPEQFWKE